VNEAIFSHLRRALIGIDPSTSLHSVLDMPLVCFAPNDLDIIEIAFRIHFMFSLDVSTLTIYVRIYIRRNEYESQTGRCMRTFQLAIVRVTGSSDQTHFGTIS
jgi:hypothetical protein